MQPFSPYLPPEAPILIVDGVEHSVPWKLAVSALEFPMKKSLLTLLDPMGHHIVKELLVYVVQTFRVAADGSLADVVECYSSKRILDRIRKP